MNSKELREKRANLAEQARALLDKAKEEKRDLTAEENEQFDKIHADIDQMKADIDRIERQEDLERELKASQGIIAGPRALEGVTDPETGLPIVTEDRGGKKQDDDLEKRTEESLKAFRTWIKDGMGYLTHEQRTLMQERMQTLPVEARAMAAGIDTAGGYIVFPEHVATIETAMKAFSGIRNTRVTIMRTNSGNQINMPTSDDTDNKGHLVGENKPVGEKDIDVGGKALHAYMFSSDFVKASIQFLQDTSITDIEGWIFGRLAERIARGLAPYLINGTGSNQPEGLAQVCQQGYQGRAKTVATWDDFVELEHSVDPAYRKQAEYLMGDGLLKQAKKLKDGEGRPLWVPGVAIKAPDTINGYNFQVDQEIPTPGGSEITMYFGDFSKFIIRDVLSMQMLRLTERFAENLQVAFLLFSRHDSALLDAGTHPIKYFKQAN